MKTTFGICKIAQIFMALFVDIIGIFSIKIKRIKTQTSLLSTVPSEGGKDTGSSRPYFGWHLQL